MLTESHKCKKHEGESTDAGTQGRNSHRVQGLQGLKPIVWTHLVMADSKSLFTPINSLRNKMLISLVVVIGLGWIAIYLLARGTFQESEEKFTNLVTHAPIGLSTINKGGTYEYVNPKFTEIFGYTLEDIPRREHWLEKAYPDPEYRQKVQACWKEDSAAAKVGKAPPRVFTVTCKDGSLKEILFKRVALTDESDLVTCEDITERKLAEKALRESEEKYRTLFDSSKDAIIVISKDGKFVDVNAASVELLGYDNKEEFMTIESVAQLCFNPEGQSSIREMLSKQDHVKDLEQELRKKNGEKVYALLTAGPRKDSKGNVIGYRGTIRDITGRKKMEEALRESEDKFRGLVENSIVGVYLIQDGVFRYVNSRFAEIHGYKIEEMVGKMDPKQTTFPEDLPIVGRNISKRIEGEEETTHYEFRIITKSQEVKYVEVFGSRTMYQGRSAVIGTMLDITKRKQGEEALRQSEEKYRAILENMAEGYFEVDLAGNVTLVNDAECVVLGYSRQELIGMNNRQYTDKETAKKMFEAFNRLHTTGEPVKGLEEEVIRKDGTRAIRELSVSLIRDSEEKPIGFRATSRDITERKRAEESLRQSEERYRNILESIDEGIYEVDLAGNFTFLNDSMARIFGYLKEELLGMNNRQYTDQESAKKLFESFNQVYRTGEPGAECSYEITRKDGTKRCIETSASLRKDPSGKPIGFRGVARDITNLKRAAGSEDVV